MRRATVHIILGIHGSGCTVLAHKVALEMGCIIVSEVKTPFIPKFVRAWLERKNLVRHLKRNHTLVLDLSVYSIAKLRELMVLARNHGYMCTWHPTNTEWCMDITRLLHVNKYKYTREEVYNMLEEYRELRKISYESLIAEL